MVVGGRHGSVVWWKFSEKADIARLLVAIIKLVRVHKVSST
jgi:hypothetical protein